MATTGQVSDDGHLPPGLIVEASEDAITEVFAELCPLQPVRMEADGLVCAPRCAPEQAAMALAACPLPVRALATVPGWPDPPAAMVAGWYRRSPGHAAAPRGLRELVQAPGGAFGPGDHVTTTMCLELLEEIPDGPAVDVGCGSGLLTQAWVALEKGEVIACDLDAAALDQTSRSLRAAGRSDRVALRRGPAGTLRDDELSGRVLIANIPASSHGSLLSRISAPPPAAVLSGLRAAQASAVIDAYRAVGLDTVRYEERAGFVAASLMGP